MCRQVERMMPHSCGLRIMMRGVRFDAPANGENDASFVRPGTINGYAVPESELLRKLGSCATP